MSHYRQVEKIRRKIAKSDIASSVAIYIPTFSKAKLAAANYCARLINLTHNYELDAEYRGNYSLWPGTKILSTSGSRCDRSGM